MRTGRKYRLDNLTAKAKSSEIRIMNLKNS